MPALFCAAAINVAQYGVAGSGEGGVDRRVYGARVAKGLAGVEQFAALAIGQRSGGGL